MGDIFRHDIICKGSGQQRVSFNFLTKTSYELSLVEVAETLRKMGFVDTSHMCMCSGWSANSKSNSNATVSFYVDANNNFYFLRRNNTNNTSEPVYIDVSIISYNIYKVY